MGKNVCSASLPCGLNEKQYKNKNGCRARFKQLRCSVVLAPPIIASCHVNSSRAKNHLVLEARTGQQVPLRSLTGQGLHSVFVPILI